MKRLNKIIYWVACFILTSGLSTYASDAVPRLTGKDGARSPAPVATSSHNVQPRMRNAGR
jgi:hypothetical protein